MADPLMGIDHTASLPLMAIDHTEDQPMQINHLESLHPQYPPKGHNQPISIVQLLTQKIVSIKLQPLYNL